MKRNILMLLSLNILFVIFLVLSGSQGGIMSSVLYISAFALPVFMGIFYRKSGGGEIDLSSLIKIKKREESLLALTLFFPACLFILIISLLTSLLLYALGMSETVSVGDSLLYAILRHALLVSVLEELMFRALPRLLLSRERPLLLLFLSAAFFSLAHMSLFSLLYAFVAGLILMALYLFTDSLLLPIGLHFLNNLLSLLFIMYGEDKRFCAVFFIVIGVLTLLSLGAAFAFRKRFSAIFAMKGKNDEEYN